MHNYVAGNDARLRLRFIGYAGIFENLHFSRAINPLACISLYATHELGDGSVRFTTNQIDINVWRAMSTTRGGETVSEGT